jgi:hypothetical protein
MTKHFTLFLSFLTLWLCGCGSSSDKPAPTAATAKPPRPPKIVMFYTAAATVERGKGVLLCYGVDDTASVSLTPPVETLKPSPTRCFEVKPEKSTDYTLEAKNAAGQSVTQTVSIKVVGRGAAPSPADRSASAPPAAGGGLRINSFRLDKRDAASANLCYEVSGAATVSVEPHALPTVHALRGCFLVAPQKTTTYTLTAAAPDGRKITKNLTIPVP